MPHLFRRPLRRCRLQALLLRGWRFQLWQGAPQGLRAALDQGQVRPRNVSLLPLLLGLHIQRGKPQPQRFLRPRRRRNERGVSQPRPDSGPIKPPRYLFLPLVRRPPGLSVRTQPPPRLRLSQELVVMQAGTGPDADFGMSSSCTPRHVHYSPGRHFVCFSVVRSYSCVNISTRTTSDSDCQSTIPRTGST